MKRTSTHLDIIMPDGSRYEINGYPDAKEMMRVHEDLKKNVEGTVAIHEGGEPKIFHGSDWVDMGTFQPEELRNMGVSKTIMDKYVKKSDRNRVPLTPDEPMDKKERERQLDEIETLITEKVMSLRSKKYDLEHEVAQISEKMSNLNSVLKKFWHSGMSKEDWNTVKEHVGVELPAWVYKHSLKHLPPKDKSILDPPEYTLRKEEAEMDKFSSYSKSYKEYDITEDMYKKIRQYMYGDAREMLGKDDEIDTTQLAENAAHHALDKDHDEWLDDETNPIWDIAYEVSESFED